MAKPNSKASEQPDYGGR